MIFEVKQGKKRVIIWVSESLAGTLSYRADRTVEPGLTFTSKPSMEPVKPKIENPIESEFKYTT